MSTEKRIPVTAREKAKKKSDEPLIDSLKASPIEIFRMHPGERKSLIWTIRKYFGMGVFPSSSGAVETLSRIQSVAYAPYAQAMCNIVMSRKRETDDSMKQVYLKRASMLLIGLSEAGEPLAMFLYSLASLLQCPPRNRKDAMEDMIEAAKHGVSAASYEIWATPFPNCNPAEFRCLAETRFHYRMLYTSLSISVREYGRVITGKEDIIRAALLYSLAKPNHNDRIFAIDVLGRASFDVVYRTIIKEVIRVKHGFLLTPDESDLRLESYVVAEYLLRKDEKSAKLIDERLIIFSDEIRNYGRSRAKYFATYEQFQKRAFNK